ncbi:hypothetical protein Q0812_13595 [Brevundimonas sp. 2R-24]|uniref:Tail specific protease domain-containing protein n=1 Tax=Peiella sedimenti TaxID=3061083 RepID=A0ABT8SQY2_9CAUL|nr:hypothetical protein [Caulobacteraceae bacterium XZ-24]
MLTRRSLAGVAGVLFATGASDAAGAQAQHQPPPAGPQAPGGSRAEEAASLRRFAETTHPRGREAVADTAWLAHWSALERNAGDLSDGAYALALRRGLAWFADGHTTVLPPEFAGVPDPLKGGVFGKQLPARARPFADGLYITSATVEFEALKGRKITAIGGEDVNHLLRRWAETWCGSPAWARNWAGTMFTPAALEGMGINASGGVEVRTDAGAVTLPLLAEAERTAITTPPMPPEAWRSGGAVNFVRDLPDRGALYLGMDAHSEGDDAMRTFSQQALAAMDSTSAARVVLDLRRNGGGDNFWGEPLRKALERSRFNRPGGLYVLISPATFSAAQNLATRLERETYALFGGEPTGGAPNHYGDAQFWTGGVTGLMAMVSTIPWFDSYPMDRRNWIMPDQIIPATFADFVAGRDPALEWALTHTTAAQADDLAQDRVFFFGRASQRAAWAPFWS